MRYPKYLINAFAILGVASFIFLACSASETAMNEDPIENNDDNDGNNDGDNNPPIQNNNGKYQISTSQASDISNGSPRTFLYTTILNTETGQVSLYFSSTNGSWAYNLLRTENIAN